MTPQSGTPPNGEPDGSHVTCGRGGGVVCVCVRPNWNWNEEADRLTEPRGACLNPSKARAWMAKVRGEATGAGNSRPQHMQAKPRPAAMQRRSGQPAAPPGGAAARGGITGSMWAQTSGHSGRLGRMRWAHLPQNVLAPSRPGPGPREWRAPKGAGRHSSSCAAHAHSEPRACSRARPAARLLTRTASRARARAAHSQAGTGGDQRQARRQGPKGIHRTAWPAPPAGSGGAYRRRPQQGAGTSDEARRVHAACVLNRSKAIKGSARISAGVPEGRP
ncbi:MAG: hypothetical protein J3K34DRAFT_442019 [Monoraphidium minutum]|nr:MAG: hypothetical protein J3K34DRAFT_442019 [Monoraphidium minutum]